MAQDRNLPLIEGNAGALLLLDGTTGIPKGIQNAEGSAMFPQVMTFAQMMAMTNVTDGTQVIVIDYHYAPFSYTEGHWSSLAPLQLMNAGIPFVRSGSGTIGNNGAFSLSGTNALPTAYPGAFFYMPTGALFAGTVAGTSAAGWYFGQMASTVAGTIYNNPYPNPTYNITGDPDESAPYEAGGKFAGNVIKPFVTTGPGAFTQTTAAIVAQNYTQMPANLVGPFGGLNYKVLADRSLNADAASLSVQVGSGTSAQTIAQVNATGINSAYIDRTMLNLGGYAAQANPPLSLSGPGTSSSVPTFYTSIDFSKSQNIQIVLQALANDFYVVTGFQVDVIFS